MRQTKINKGDNPPVVSHFNTCLVYIQFIHGSDSWYVSCQHLTGVRATTPFISKNICASNSEMFSVLSVTILMHDIR
jgi:hypothetical protein